MPEIKHRFDFDYARDFGVKIIQGRKFKLPHGLKAELGLSNKRNTVFFITKNGKCFGYLKLSNVESDEFDDPRIVLRFVPRREHRLNFSFPRWPKRTIYYDCFKCDMKNLIRRFLYEAIVDNFQISFND